MPSPAPGMNQHPCISTRRGLTGWGTALLRRLRALGESRLNTSDSSIPCVMSSVLGCDKSTDYRKQMDRGLSLAGPSCDQMWNTAPSVGFSCMRKWLISFRKPNQQGDLCLEHTTCEKNLKLSGFSSLKEESCMWVWQTNLPTLQSKTQHIADRFFDEVNMGRMKQWHKTQMGRFNWIEGKNILLRTIKYWSWLPREYRNTPSLEVFKTQLEKAPRSLIRIQLSMIHWADQSLKDSFQCEWLGPILIKVTLTKLEEPWF